MGAKYVQQIPETAASMVRHGPIGRRFLTLTRPIFLFSETMETIE